MKKSSIIVYFLVLFSLIANAQVKVVGEVNVTGFPSLNFEINNRNPEFKGVDSYSFSQLLSGRETLIDSISFTQIPDSLDYSKKNKCVIILIEAINQKNGATLEQVNTFFYALRDALPNFVNPGDKIKIVGFAWRGDDGVVLNPFHNTFTDNVDLLKNALNSFDLSKNTKRRFSVSEIPGAILESIDLLVGVPVDFNKSILLLSEERTNKYSTDKTFVNVVKVAQEKEVVINTIKYNKVGFQTFTNPFLADQTYGERRVLKLSPGNLRRSNTDKQKEAAIEISNILNNTVKRSMGTNAAVSLEAAKVYSDGSEHSILIKELNAPHQKELAYNAPGNWYYAQFEKDFYITLIISLLAGIIIIILINLFLKKQKEQSEKKLEDKEKHQQVQLKQEAEISKQKNELEKIKNTEQNRINQLRQEQGIKVQKAAEALLIKEMKALGNLPILKFTDLNSSKSFEIIKPSVSIGRDVNSNDFYVDNPNMSRTHFVISFKENTYKILDSNSTNGMIVNGYKLKESVLKNGDIIEIADCTFTFYI